VRLFVAVEIAPSVARAAHALTEKLRERAALLAPGARLAWVSPDRLHLTIRFIGPVAPDPGAAIQDALRPVLVVHRFAATIGRLGAFPEHGAPAVLWAGVADPEGGLASIEAEISARLARAGLPRETRPFRAHLTLARVKIAAGLRTQPLFEGFEALELGTTQVEAITLFESRLSPRGPRYVAVQRTALSGSGAATPGDDVGHG
jgi:2'-5' RNA ligase